MTKGPKIEISTHTIFYYQKLVYIFLFKNKNEIASIRHFSACLITFRSMSDTPLLGGFDIICLDWFLLMERLEYVIC